MCLEMMPSWCRQVNWENCGIPWVNCTVLCVKDDWKGQFWGLRYCLSKLRNLLSFSWGRRHTVKSPSFNWECIGRFTSCGLADICRHFKHVITFLCICCWTIYLLKSNGSFVYLSVICMYSPVKDRHQHWSTADVGHPFPLPPCYCRRS